MRLSETNLIKVPRICSVLVAAGGLAFLVGNAELQAAQKQPETLGRPPTDNRSQVSESAALAAPTGLRITGRTQTTMALDWVPYGEAAAATGYRLYENVRINRFRSQWRLKSDGITTSQVEIGGLEPGSSHEFAVALLDRDGTESERSIAVKGTTLQSPIAYHPIHRSDEKIEAIVEQVFRYSVLAAGVPRPTFSLFDGPPGMVVDRGSGLVQWTPIAGKEGSVAASVRAENSEGSDLHSFTITVHPAGTDLVAPESVRVAVARDVTAEGVTLKWRPAKDNVSVAGYRILAQRFGRGNSLFLAGDSPGSGNSHKVTNLEPGTGYRFWIQPYDAAGNLASISGVRPINVTTRHGGTAEQE